MKAQSKLLVGVVMGSKSDWDVMRHSVDTLTELGKNWMRRQAVPALSV